MGRYFCRDKKDYCDILNCKSCEFAKGHGVIDGVYANDVLTTLFGESYNLAHLKQIIEADREGRCVLTKCKIGDTVFVVGKKKIVKARVQEIYLDDMPELIYLVDFECDNCCDGCPFNSWSQSWEGEWQCDGEYGDGSIKDSNFGKNVFRTREEAEVALKTMKEGE